MLVPALGTAAAPLAARPQRAGDRRAGWPSLVDGRGGAVVRAALRADARRTWSCPAPSVRHHAELSVDPSGYVLRDASASGVFINGARIGDAQLLRRADVIRIGAEEFLFYSDPIDRLLAEAPGSPPAQRVGAVVSGEAAALATLEVVHEGASKGTVYRIRTPLAHIGRGEHNDVIVVDDSVSDSHAKIQRRESGWFVVDMDSTNGTYVAGERIRGERALGGSTAVRFGGVKVIFRSDPQIVDADGGTRVIVGVKPSHQQRVPMARHTVATRQADASDSTRTRRVSPLVWIAAAVAIGATVLLVIQDR